MERREFEQLVLKYEEMAAKKPENFARWLRWYSFIGFALYTIFISFTVLLFLILLAAFVMMIVSLKVNGGLYVLAIMIGSLGIFIKMLITPLFGRHVRPEAYFLRKEECPELFQRVEEIRKQLNCGKVHEIGIMNDVNAYITQIPRFGMLPFTRNYLILGLPLLLGSSKQEMDSVIAHELSHISQNHSKRRARTLKYCRIWGQIRGEMEKEAQKKGKPAPWMIRKFTDWYFCRFNAMTLGLNRLQEFDADSDAKRLFGRAVFGQNSVRMIFLAQRENEFWENRIDQHVSKPTPPENILEDLPQFIRVFPDLDEMKKDLEKSLRVGTSVYESHPSMKDRLVNVGFPDYDQSLDQIPPIQALFEADSLPSDSPYRCYSEIEPAEINQYASDYYIPQVQSHLLRFFSIVWKSKIEPHWKQLSQERKTYLDLEERILNTQNIEELTPDEQLTLAYVYYRKKQPDKVKGLAEKLLNHPTTEAQSRCLLGQVLLDGGEEELAFEHLKSAVEVNPHTLPEALSIKLAYYQSKGKNDTLIGLLLEHDEYSKAVDEANQERGRITPNDSFLPQDLSEDDVAKLTEELAKRQDVKKGYLIRRNFHLFPKQKGYLLILVVREKWYHRPTKVNQLVIKARDHYADFAFTKEA